MLHDRRLCRLGNWDQEDELQVLIAIATYLRVHRSRNCPSCWALQKLATWTFELRLGLGDESARDPPDRARGHFALDSNKSRNLDLMKNMKTRKPFTSLWISATSNPRWYQRALSIDSLWVCLYATDEAPLTQRAQGLDTPTPFLQLSGTIFKGQHDSLLGTEILFTDTKGTCAYHYLHPTRPYS
jgi:hypothetical protein